MTGGKRKWTASPVRACLQLHYWNGKLASGFSARNTGVVFDERARPKPSRSPTRRPVDLPDVIAGGELRALLQTRAHVQAAVEAVAAVPEKHVTAYFARQRRWQVDTAPRRATIKPGARGRASFQSSLNQPANARLRPVQRRAPP
jgi:hypothetical protein